MKWIAYIDVRLGVYGHLYVLTDQEVEMIQEGRLHELEEIPVADLKYRKCSAELAAELLQESPNRLLFLGRSRSATEEEIGITLKMWHDYLGYDEMDQRHRFNTHQIFLSIGEQFAELFNF